MQLDWSNIKTVLLDMDGTLLDLHFDSHFWLHHLPRVYGETKQLEPAQVAEKLNPLFRDHAGTLNWYCVDFWSQELEIDIMQIKAEVAHKIGYRPQAEAFLSHCRQQVNDLRLITNAHRRVLDLKIKHTAIDQYFDQLVCSHELGAPKEQADFWLRLQAMRGFDLDSTLFIDDSEAVLDAAAHYGVKHIYSIAQPDSRAEQTKHSKYPMLDSFSFARPL